MFFDILFGLCEDFLYLCLINIVMIHESQSIAHCGIINIQISQNFTDCGIIIYNNSEITIMLLKWKDYRRILDFIYIGLYFFRFWNAFLGYLVKFVFWNFDLVVLFGQSLNS